MTLIPYIYNPEISIDVYNKTMDFLAQNADIKNQIEELGLVYHTIGNIIPQTMDNIWSGHYIPYLDSWEEIQVSLTQVCMGLYKQAFVSMRIALELGLLSVYFNINDEGHETVKQWLHSKENREANTPKSETIWRILLSNDNIREFDRRHKLKEKFEELGYLHNYVHTKGHKYSNRMGLFKSNFQTFESELIVKWLDTYTKIVTMISTLHLLKYPISVIRFDYSTKFGIDVPSFGGLEQYSIDRISNLLPEDYFKTIEELAQKDSPTIEIMSKISSMPNFTDEQLDEQIIRVNKFSIQHGEGFIQWRKNELLSLSKSGRSADDMRIKNRIIQLEEWAIENGFMEPKSMRNKHGKRS